MTKDQVAFGPASPAHETAPGGAVVAQMGQLVQADVHEEVPSSAGKPTQVLKEDPGKPLRLTKRCWIILALFGCLVVLGVALGVVFATKNKGQSSGSSSNPEANFEERYASFRAIVAGQSSPIAFSNPDSPQSKALTWLVYEDKSISDETQVDRIIQRYAMMVLFYACSGDDWKGTIVPLDEQVDTNECDFFGVSCNDDGTIVGLDLHFQRLVGQLPAEMGSLSSLTSLILSDNYLEGSVPETIYSLTNLQTLDLSANGFLGTISPAIGNLKELEKLSLMNNIFTSSLPSTLTELTKLRFFDCGYNDFVGDVFAYMPSWPLLEEFRADSTDFRGSLPEGMTALTNLKYIHISATPLTGSLPSGFSQLTSLEVIELDNRYTSNVTLPNGIGDLVNLTKIVVSSRGMGTIPTSIGNLEQLTELSIITTNFNGTVPTEIGLLTNLVSLSISGSPYLVGTIPSEVAQLTKLDYIVIRNNGIRGTVDAFCNAPMRDYFAYSCDLTCNCCTVNCHGCIITNTSLHAAGGCDNNATSP